MGYYIFQGFQSYVLSVSFSLFVYVQYTETNLFTKTCFLSRSNQDIRIRLV